MPLALDSNHGTNVRAGDGAHLTPRADNLAAQRQIRYGLEIVLLADCGTGSVWEKAVRAYSKEQMMDELTVMLRDLFEQRRSGVPMSRLARAHGYVDGYMRVMLDAGMATKKELLDVVNSERTACDGPALRVSPQTAA